MTIALLVKLQMAMQKECINILMQLAAAATYCITSCPSQCLRRKLATFETKVERHIWNQSRKTQVQSNNNTHHNLKSIGFSGPLIAGYKWFYIWVQFLSWGGGQENDFGLGGTCGGGLSGSISTRMNAPTLALVHPPALLIPLATGHPYQYIASLTHDHFPQNEQDLKWSKLATKLML